MLRFSCPHCSKSLKAPDGAADQTITCPKCGNPIQVNTEESEARLAASSVQGSPTVQQPVTYWQPATTEPKRPKPEDRPVATPAQSRFRISAIVAWIMLGLTVLWPIGGVSSCVFVYATMPPGKPVGGGYVIDETGAELTRSQHQFRNLEASALLTCCGSTGIYIVLMLIAGCTYFALRASNS
jgi:hypothetical protein